MTRIMKRAYFLSICIAAAASLAASCCRIDRTEQILASAEKNLYAHPDSVFHILEKIDRSYLDSDKMQADFALLYSAASDLSGLKELNDSLIGIATRYYSSKRGSEKQKVLSYYYCGKAHDIAGNENMAMLCFVKAGKHAIKVDDPMLEGKVNFSKARLYEYAFAYKDALECYTEAGRMFFQAGNMVDFVESTLRSARCYIELGDRNNAEKCLDAIDLYWENASETDKIRYFRAKGKLDSDNDFDVIKAALNREIQKMESPSDSKKLLLISDIYLQGGYMDSAMVYLSKYAEIQSGSRNSSMFYQRLANLYDSLGLYRQAYTAYRKHVALKDSIYLDKIQESVQHVEERYDKQVKLHKMKSGRAILIITFSLLSTAGLALFFLLRRKYRKQSMKTKKLEEMYNSAVAEKEMLSEMVSHCVMIDEPIRKLLESRVSVLDELIATLLFDKNNYSPAKAAGLIESIAMDKETYMNTLGLIFSIRHPEVAEHLKKCGLSIWEIGYCSLYCMGYKGKEIGNIMCASKYYKLNSSLRKKLGLGPKETNIDIYLRGLMGRIEGNIPSQK